MSANKNTWGIVLKIVIAVVTSIASVLGITSCIH